MLGSFYQRLSPPRVGFLSPPQRPSTTQMSATFPSGRIFGFCSLPVGLAHRLRLTLPTRPRRRPAPALSSPASLVSAPSWACAGVCVVRAGASLPVLARACGPRAPASARVRQPTESRRPSQSRACAALPRPVWNRLSNDLPRPLSPSLAPSPPGLNAAALARKHKAAPYFFLPLLAAHSA